MTYALCVGLGIIYLFIGGAFFAGWEEAEGRGKGPPAELCAFAWPFLAAGLAIYYGGRLAGVVGRLPFVAYRSIQASRARAQLPEARLIKRDP